MKNERAMLFDLVLYNGNVVDVVAGRIIPHQCVIVDRDSGKITHIMNDDDNDNERQGLLKKCKESFDCQGGFIMPGLIDCHVHVTAFTANFALLETTSPAYVTARAIHILRQMLHRGFTTVRDAGGADHGLARAIQEGHVVGPRLLFCGKALSQTGGHGDMRAPGDFATALSNNNCCSGLGRICDGDAQVRRAARDEIRKGATHIKVMAGGGVSSPTDRITSTQFSVQELTSIVEEAEAASVYVMAHAYTPRAIMNAVLAGVKSIEHGNLLNEESAKAMADAGTFLVPTLVTYHALAEEGASQGLTPEMVSKIDFVLEAGKRSIGIAKNAGVCMSFGSDLLGEMHRHQLRGLALMEDAGLTPLEVIRCATVNAALLINLQDEIGVIKEGATADLLILTKNPLLSTRVFSEEWEECCIAVLKSGRMYHQEPTI
jgi:imidazolonepropionase-like amidohydrolase